MPRLGWQTGISISKFVGSFGCARTLLQSNVWVQLHVWVQLRIENHWGSLQSQAALCYLALAAILLSRLLNSFCSEILSGSKALLEKWTGFSYFVLSPLNVMP